MDRSFFLKSIAALSGVGILGLKTAEGFVKAGPDHFFHALRSDQDIAWDILRSNFSLPAGYRYFNTAGCGAVPEFVRQYVMKYWNDTEVHPAPGHNDAVWVNIKKSIARAVGLGDNYRGIALTNSTTAGINIILNGIDFKNGDQIITSTHEHPALHAPLINLAQRKSLIIQSFEPDLEIGLNNVKRIFDLAGPRTRLIFISLITCTCGQLLPVREIIEEAHKRNILVALDGAQSTGNSIIELLDLDVDFYTSGGQKWLLGPKRTGFLYVKPTLLDFVRPTTVGAYSEASYSIKDLSITWAHDATRYEYATQNDSLFFGLGKSIGFLSNLGWDNIVKHDRLLAERFYEGLKAIHGVKVISPNEYKYRTPIISFSVDGMCYKNLANELGRRGFRVRMVHEAGLEAVRASFHVYNNESEIDAMLEAIADISQ